MMANLTILTKKNEDTCKKKEEEIRALKFKIENMEKESVVIILLFIH